MKKTTKFKLLLGFQIGILLTVIALPVQAAINVGAPQTLSGSVVSLRSHVSKIQAPAPTSKTQTDATRPVATSVQNPTTSQSQSIKIGQPNSGNIVSLKNILNQSTSKSETVTPTAPSTVASPTKGASDTTTTTSPSATPSNPSPSNPSTAVAPTQPIIPSVATVTAEEQLMVDMINQERMAAGVSPLKLDLRLVSVAQAKADDLKANNYFDHTSPTYGSPWAMMQQAGLTVGWAGENISANNSVKNSMTALMQSPGHRANILDPRFTHVGVGIVYGSSYGNLYVQEFLQE